MKRRRDRSVGYMLGPIRRHYLFSRKMVILDWSLHPDLKHMYRASQHKTRHAMGTRECSKREDINLSECWDQFVDIIYSVERW